MLSLEGVQGDVMTTSVRDIRAYTLVEQRTQKCNIGTHECRGVSARGLSSV